jgi:hypothetical protein
MSEELVSTGTVLTLIVGLIIASIYLRHMWGALQRAVQTRDDPDVGHDEYRFSFIGAIVAVIASVVAIAIYGAGPGFLYVGPALALLAAIAVAYCLREEHLDVEGDR